MPDEIQHTKRRVDAYSQLQQLSALPCDAQEWVDFTTRVVGLPDCYAPAAQAVIRQNRWRRLSGKQNLIGYVKTATMREALKMGLALDRYLPNEPRVLTKERPQPSPTSPALGTVGLVDLPLPRSFNWSSPEESEASGGSGVEATDNGYSYEDHLDHLQRKAHPQELQPDDLQRQIPYWLRRADERDAVDWDKVARCAVLKRHMASVVAKVLKLKAEGVGRPAAVARASTPQKAQEIEAAWKWVDRNWLTRIVPVFQLDHPPDALLSHVSSGRVKFIPPGSALREVLQRKQATLDMVTAGPSLAGPSLAEAEKDKLAHDLLAQFMREVGYSQDYTLDRTGMFCRLTLNGASSTPVVLYQIHAIDLDWDGMFCGLTPNGELVVI